jgi:hypothetical protein
MFQRPERLGSDIEDVERTHVDRRRGSHAAGQVVVHNRPGYLLTMETRYDEMLAQFKEFDRQNPEVWELFVRFTRQTIQKGFRNYSAQLIIERLRWHTDKPDERGQSTFKINNNFNTFYARKFMAFYPQHEGFFRLRVQKSKMESASGLPPLTPADFPYTNQGGQQTLFQL